MAELFEQVSHIFRDIELADFLVIILIVSLIALNITGCVCVISMRKSLKKIADHHCPYDKKSNELANAKNQSDQKSKG